MYLRFYKSNKNGEVLGKFYEIVQKKEKVYIHYGSIPNGPMSLPWGRFEEYVFDNKHDAGMFWEKKSDEKLNKGYELEKINGNTVNQSNIFKWMLKNAKPTVKNMASKKTTTKVKTKTKTKTNSKNKTKKKGRT